MSTVLQRNLGSFKAGGVIAKGQAVKFSANATVVACSATTDQAIGIAQNAAILNDVLEVALPGGGGFGLAKTTIAQGDRLGINADGSLQKVASANDIVIAHATEAAAAADIFAVFVVLYQATTTQS